MQASIYFDNNSTTALDPIVLEEMLPYFTQIYGNASNTNHAFGKHAATAVSIARERLAKLLGANEKELTFTSGATEAINMAIKGVFNRYKTLGNHIITCETEHKAVLDVCRYLEKKGAEVTYLPVDRQGNISLDDLRNSIRKETILVSLMFANNETGLIHPMHEIAEICTEKEVLLFCDATQAVGKIEFSLQDLNIDLLCCSGHKFFGPKGIGALYVRNKRKRIQVDALIRGGGQEGGLRGGTLNVPAIVGIGKAARLCMSVMNEESIRVAALRDHLEKSLLELEQSYVNGKNANRLPQVCNITFRFVKAEHIMARVRSLAISSGSACSTGSLDPSHVLLAMGLSQEDAHGSLRFSLGRFNTLNEVNIAVRLVITAVNELRDESPIWKLYQDGTIF